MNSYTPKILLPLVALLLLASPALAADPAWTRDDAAHLLRRAGFSGTPDQIDRLFSYGQSDAVDYLLDAKTPAGQPPVFAPSLLPDFQLADLSIGKVKGKSAQGEIQAVRAWWIDRMARTDRPLEEKMSLFWHGLFCSGLKETKSAYLMAAQNALFHKEALGNYRHLTHSIVHDPAMLKYLNANENTQAKPNENLARELMELFTLGEGNGYTEKDIAEVARALTGATGGPASYVFRPGQHDDQPKTILGHTGNYKPDDVVDLIFDTKLPAEYLARRLWLYFAGPDPADADLAPIADALLKNNYDLKPALRVLFTSPAFYSAKTRFALIRSPADLVVSTLRQLDITPPQPMLLGLGAALQQMSQALFQPPNVRGWPGGEQWITSATLYTRYNTMQSILEGTLRPGPGGGGKKAKLQNEPTALQSSPDSTAPDSPALAAAQDTSSTTFFLLKKPNKAKLRPAANALAAAPTTAPSTNPIRNIPDVPRTAGPVSPGKLFPKLPASPTPAQVVDAAISRLMQRPLADKKHKC